MDEEEGIEVNGHYYYIWTRERDGGVERRRLARSIALRLVLFQEFCPYMVIID